MKCFQANRQGRWNDRKPSTQKEARKERKSNIVTDNINGLKAKDCQTGFCKNDMLFGSYMSKT